MLVLLGFGLLAADVQAETAARSLVDNSGFEAWQEAPARLQLAIDCRQLPAGWMLNPGLTGKQYAVLDDAETKHGGNHSARLSNTDTASGIVIAQRLEAEAEMRYKIRLWLKGEKIDAYHPKGIVVTLVASTQSDMQDNSMWSGALRVTDKAPSPNQGTFAWTELVFTVDTPVKTRSLMLCIQLRGAGVAWVDDVEMTPLEKCVQVESY